MLFKPFDFNPSLTSQSAASYTVPAGRYAIATVTLSVSAFVDETGANVNVADIQVSNDSQSTTLYLHLNTGDALTKSTSAASGSQIGGVSVVDTAYITGTSLARVYVNATSVGEISCHGFGAFRTSVSGQFTVNISGTATVMWQIAEYIIPT